MNYLRYFWIVAVLFFISLTIYYIFKKYMKHMEKKYYDLILNILFAISGIFFIFLCIIRILFNISIIYKIKYFYIL
jgi:hypothetical protein